MQSNAFYGIDKCPRPVTVNWQNYKNSFANNNLTIIALFIQSVIHIFVHFSFFGVIGQTSVESIALWIKTEDFWAFYGVNFEMIWNIFLILQRIKLKNTEWILIPYGRAKSDKNVQLVTKRPKTKHWLYLANVAMGQ